MTMNFAILTVHYSCRLLFALYVFPCCPLPAENNWLTFFSMLHFCSFWNCLWKSCCFWSDQKSNNLANFLSTFQSICHLNKPHVKTSSLCFIKSCQTVKVSANDYGDESTARRNPTGFICIPLQRMQF